MEKFKELAQEYLPGDAHVERELSDAEGPYLIELQHKTNDGWVTELRYQRATWKRV
jgi:hypothetical protein